MKHLFISFYAVRISQLSGQYLSAKYLDIIGSDVSVLPDEHLYSIIVYGSNVYNFVANGLIITETISYIRKSGRFAKLEAFE